MRRRVMSVLYDLNVVESQEGSHLLSPDKVRLHKSAWTGDTPVRLLCASASSNLCELNDVNTGEIVHRVQQC